MDPTGVIDCDAWPPAPAVVAGGVVVLNRRGVPVEEIRIRPGDFDFYRGQVRGGTGHSHHDAALYFFGMRVKLAPELTPGTLELHTAAPYEPAFVLLRKSNPIGDGTPLETGRA